MSGEDSGGQVPVGPDRRSPVREAKTVAAELYVIVRVSVASGFVSGRKQGSFPSSLMSELLVFSAVAHTGAGGKR